MAKSTPTETVVSSNTQDFSDGDIVDGFSDGPVDDGTPMGLGGEKGNQTEPANATLEADIASQDQNTPGDDLPPDDSARGPSEPVQDTTSEGGDEPQVPDEPKIPEFPPVLLQMAGYDTPEAAQRAGFQDPASLMAAVQWRSQLLAPEATPKPPEDRLYRQPPVQPPRQQQVQQPPVQPEQQDNSAGFKPFQPANADLLDEELLTLIQQQNEHFADQFRRQEERFTSELKSLDDRTSAQQAFDEEVQFDKAIQGLGEGWQDTFGKGNGQDLAAVANRDPASMTAFNHRAMMFAAVEAVREANAKQGFKPMTVEQEVQWALMQRYPEKFQQQLRQQTAAKANGRRGVQASRPTARKTPAGNKNERLLSTIDAKLRAKGRGGLDMGMEEDFDGDI
jgi:hypothetical protein